MKSKAKKDQGYMFLIDASAKNNPRIFLNLTGNWEGTLGREHRGGFGKGALGRDTLGEGASKEDTLRGGLCEKGH